MLCEALTAARLVSTGRASVAVEHDDALPSTAGLTREQKAALHALAGKYAHHVLSAEIRRELGSAGCRREAVSTPVGAGAAHRAAPQQRTGADARGEGRRDVLLSAASRARP